MKLIDSLYKLNEAEWVVVGIPFSGKVSALKGSEKAPNALRRHFQDYWTYDLKRQRDLSDIPIFDAGDVKAKTYASLDKELSKKIADIKKKNWKAKILFIGGDHSITPLITKQLKIHSFLALDAHFDLMDALNGDRNSHACASRRVYEQNVELHLRGIRSSSREEHDFAVTNGIDWRSDAGFNGKIDYFSLDVDVMDPCFIGTGTPEMFGATPESVVNTIRNTDFKYFDVMEWVPEQGFAYLVQIVKEVLFK